jgi:serine phosphatase RsbU (regulator of sigma subunit)
MVPSDSDGFEATTVASREQLAAALAALDDSAHYLVAVDGSDKGRRVEIGLLSPITVGRDSRLVLSFNDTDLSGSHLRVSIESGHAVAEDLGSTNGTFVNDERITEPRKLQDGDTVRAGRQALRYERRSRREIERARALERELNAARGYVLAVLPDPIASGPVQTAWRFVPSTALGGDGFGYCWLDRTLFAFYLIDVSGHGVGPAMHSVTVLNLLRQHALPDVDFTNPADVLRSLNARFQMDRHGGLFFTMWYGVYRTTDRVLTCSAAGHHPAFLIDADRRAAQPLGSPALMIGAMEDAEYETEQTIVPPGSSIHVFSDGVFEIETASGEMWGVDGLLPLLLEAPLAGTTEPDRVYRGVVKASLRDPLPDDFSLMTVKIT